MPSKKLTLADYLQKHDAIRNPNRYQGLSETQRQRLEYFDAKKKKVGILMSDILYSVKKSCPNLEEYLRIEKIVKATAQEIKTQFDHANAFTQEKAKDTNQMETEADLWRTSLEKNVQNKESEQKVLKESNKACQGGNLTNMRKENQRAERSKENSKGQEMKPRILFGQGR